MTLIKVSTSDLLQQKKKKKKVFTSDVWSGSRGGVLSNFKGCKIYPEKLRSF
jgi:hypothetical protein